MSKPKTRPTTGKLLVGGDFYLHTGYGIGKSWLGQEDPSKYLFGTSDFGNDADGFGQRFAIPAMNATFHSFFLDVPMARDNGALKQSQGISVFYLPEGEMWLNARYVCTLDWKPDIITTDEKGKAWRQWDDNWFRERVLSQITTDESAAREKLTGAQQLLASLGVVQTALS